MNDTISRQAAIDALDVGAELLRCVLDDADIVGAEREKYKWGLGLIELYISDMKELPSAQPERCEDCGNFNKTRLLIPQPEIVRCKDCAKREYCRTSTVWAVAPKDDWYCADAERRTDETD